MPSFKNTMEETCLATQSTSHLFLQRLAIDFELPIPLVRLLLSLSVGWNLDSLCSRELILVIALGY